MWTTEFKKPSFENDYISLNFVEWTVDLPQVEWGWKHNLKKETPNIGNHHVYSFFKFHEFNAARDGPCKHTMIQLDQLRLVLIPQVFKYHCIKISCITCPSMSKQTQDNVINGNQGAIFTHWTLDFWDNLTWGWNAQISMMVSAMPSKKGHWIRKTWILTSPTKHPHPIFQEFDNLKQDFEGRYYLEVIQPHSNRYLKRKHTV